MKKIIVIGFLFIFWWQLALSTDIICVGGKEFVINNLARKAHASGVVKVTLNIVDFKARDIKMFAVDSLRDIGIFEESTIENIRRMVFLVDTSNFSFFIKYIVLPSRYLSHDCAIVDSTNEVSLYFTGGEDKSAGELNSIISGNSYVKYLIGYLPYKDGMHLPSNIYVERIFNGSRDTTIIHNNNNPEYASIILEIAHSYSKNDFLRDAPQAKQYYIRFYIRRNIPICGCDEIF